MNWLISRMFTGVIMIALMTVIAGITHGQVGRSQGVVDPNLAVEKDLLALPHLNAAIVKGILERRPFPKP